MAGESPAPTRTADESTGHGGGPEITGGPIGHGGADIRFIRNIK